nr:histidine kinase CKI1-like [Tanacetum cinerariifolium]
MNLARVATRTLGKIGVSFSQIETKLLASESWSQQALNTTYHPFASLGHSWHDVDNPLVLSTARVGDNEVISFGFELKSFMSMLRGIIPFDGGFYLETKDGNVLATRKEMCLTSEMKNRDLEFFKASHGIRDSLVGITGMVEMSINDLQSWPKT